MLDAMKGGDGWEMAGKIGTVLAVVGWALKWLLTPLFASATRKALAPELKKIAKASEQFAAGDQRFRAIEQNMTRLEDDMRDLRERVDDIAGGRK